MKNIKISIQKLLLCILVGVVLSMSVKADQLKFTSPASNSRYKQGDKIFFSWQYCCPNKYQLTINYHVVEAGIITPKSDVISRDGVRTYEWTVPCNIVLSPSPSINNLSASLENVDEPWTCANHTPATLDLCIIDNDINAAPEQDRIPYIRCKGDLQNVCIKSERPQYVNPLTQTVQHVAENRLIKWYGVSLNDLLTQSPTAIATKITSGTYGAPIASGIKLTCLNGNEQKGYTNFFVTGGIMCPNSNTVTRTSAPTLISVSEVPDITSLIEVPDAAIELVNDNNIPCSDYFDCVLPKTYQNLPTIKKKNIILAPGYTIEDVKIEWKEHDGTVVKYVETLSGENVQRVCYDDLKLKPNRTGRYTAFITLKGTYGGQPFTCNQQKGELLIKQGADSVDPYTTAIINILLGIASTLDEKTKTLLGSQDPCVLAKILYGNGVMGYLQAIPFSDENPNGEVNALKIANHKWQILENKKANSTLKIPKEAASKIENSVEVFWEYDKTRFNLKPETLFRKKTIIVSNTRDAITESDSVVLKMRVKGAGSNQFLPVRVWKLTK